MDLASTTPATAARSLPRVRVSTAGALGALVALSAALRWLLAGGHDVPLYLPDEYVYAELARTLVETGLPRVRGEVAHFPGILQPLLAAPLWLLGDPVLSFRATQALHAVAMSLAAVPAFLTARAVGLDRATALGAAAVAVAAPGLVYSAYILSDPIGYPLALAALYAGVRALDRPTVGRELAFVALAALAVLTRVQYALVPAAFVLAALVLERRRLRAFPRRLPVTTVAVAAGVAALAALGPARLLGTYWAGTRGGSDLLGGLSWLPVDAMLLAYAAGWAIVPGAVVGLACAAVRPRSRAEAAFAALAAGLAGGLLAVAGAIAELETARFQERYLLVLVPLAAIAFGLGWRRGRGARLASAALALVLLLVAVRVPISGYVTLDAVADSPTLWAARRLAIFVRSAADGAVLVVAAASLLSLVAVAGALRRRSSGVGVLAASVAALLALSVGAHSLDTRSASIARDAAGGVPRDWIDRIGLSSVSLLQPELSSGREALSHLLWNRSVDRVLLLPGARRPDPFSITRVEPAADGRLLAPGRVVGEALLVDGHGAAVDLADATRVATAPGLALWRPEGTPRLSMLALGRYEDGWLASEGRIELWPDRSGRTAGTLRLTVSLPDDRAATSLLFLADFAASRVELEPGERRTLTFTVDRRGPVVVRFSADRWSYDGRRTTSVRASRPVFDRDA